MVDFSAALAPELTTLALCWRIVRSDGIALGFTTHDQPIWLDGLCYASAPGMAPSAVATTDGLAVDTMEVSGALSADTITAADLAAGRFDGAVVVLFMVDWQLAANGRLPLARGTLGEVTRHLTAGGGSFAATLRGPTAAFEASSVEACSPECRADLGDARCRIDLAPRTVAATITAVFDPVTVTVSSNVDDRYGQGRLRPLDGGNAGLDARISSVVNGRLILFEPLPLPLTAGTRVSLREGCDKRFVTCTGRFGNALNFRGEPHVPGGDMLTRFPGV